MTYRWSRRAVLQVIVGSAGVGVLAACSPAAAPAAPTPAANAAAPTAAAPAAPATAPAVVSAKPGSPVPITYWGAFGGRNAEVQQQLVDRFNAAQKDVVVTLQNQTNYEDLSAKFTSALQAKATPEVVLLSDVWWFKFYLNKVLQPMDELMAAENIKASDYVDVFYKESLRGTQQVWLPFARSTPIFYYNRDAFAKAGLPDRGPKTWDEFATEYVPKLNGQAPTTYAVGGAASYSAWVFQGIVWQFGGVYSDPDFKIRITEPGAVAAGEFWRSAIKSGWAKASQAPGTDFDSGAALAYIDSTAGLAGHEANAKFQVGTAFLPEGPSGFGCCTGGAGMSIVSGLPREKQQAAMKWINFATGTDNVFWAQNTGYMPVRQAALASAEMETFYKQKPNFRTAVEQLPKTRPQDVARALIPNGDQIIGKGLERITTNGEAAELAFKDVADQLNKEKEPVLRTLQSM